jgi:hypothetical protein
LLSLSEINFSANNCEKIYPLSIIENFQLEAMSTILAYDVKARKKVPMKNPQPYLMKNGSWALKGTSAETGISLFRIVGKQKPVIESENNQSHKIIPTNHFKRFVHYLVFGRNYEY